MGFKVFLAEMEGSEFRLAKSIITNTFSRRGIPLQLIGHAAERATEDTERGNLVNINLLLQSLTRLAQTIDKASPDHPHHETKLVYHAIETARQRECDVVLICNLGGVIVNVPMVWKPSSGRQGFEVHVKTIKVQKHFYTRPTDIVIHL